MKIESFFFHSKEDKAAKMRREVQEKELELMRLKNRNLETELEKARRAAAMQEETKKVCKQTI
jgi:hypothetical protein